MGGVEGVGVGVGAGLSAWVYETGRKGALIASCIDCLKFLISVLTALSAVLISDNSLNMV